ncbi:hypothetical protein [Neobacillus kokaensis]|uniref:R13L1/DRL21-like LRR repeat region domain-containing protein n=1 Tax=Neobacillus kokaensis TaxID=2759023 RepID=A0ABQ3NBP3_9BACI|nr:hypothetical protein [Neobacillus kokaensis]GHI01349.1 hypothetical protein AM1BK_48910 [Neobacillus kokaensis]
MKSYKIGNITIVRYPDDTEDTLRISSEYIEESVELINKQKFKNISIGHSQKFTDIDFLERCGGSVVNLDIHSETIKNFDGLKKLTNLKVLSLDVGKNAKLDLSVLGSLEELYGVLPGKTKGFSSLSKLKHVMIWGYNPPSKNISELSKAENIEELRIRQANLETLEGVERLSKLQFLEVYGSNKLNDIMPISELKNLTELELENCKSIRDFSPIGTLSNLESLAIVSCGSMESISFTKSLAKLKLFNFDRTNVEDGDLSYCQRIPEVYFTEKRHFSHKRKDLKDAKIDQIPLPTVFWRDRMNDGDDTFTSENINASEKALNAYIQKINCLGDTPTQKKLSSLVKEVILTFNRLNEKYDFFIETMEREELAEYILSVAELAGLKTNEDITEQWREW